MKNRLKVLFRVLQKDKIFGSITIGGLALSLSIILLLSAYIFNEYAYDNEIPNIKNIYRLCTDKKIANVDENWKTDFEEKFAEIKFACRYGNNLSEAIVENEPYSIEYLVKTDKEFFDIFSIKFAFGDSQNPLPTQNSIAISSTLAQNIFGNENPIGKTVNIGHRKDFIISSVFIDFYEKSSVQAQAIIWWENVKDIGGSLNLNGTHHSNLFVMLNENTSSVQLEEKITNNYSELHYTKRPFKLLPHKNSYMSSLTYTKEAATLHANLNSIKLFSLASILILIISVLNFIILSISNHISRYKEIGLRKTIGAGREEIFKQFLFEAVTISFIAFAFGVGLALLFESTFSSLIQKEIPFTQIFQAPHIFYILSGVLFIGVLAGLYPSIVVSRFNPISIIQSKVKIDRMQIKSGLSVVQYSISIILIVSVIVMKRQNSFVKNKDIGFTKEQLICINTGLLTKDKIPLLKQQLSSNSYINSCTASLGVPGRIREMGKWQEAREKYNYKGNVPYYTVDSDFFKVFDINFIQGRDFQFSDRGKSAIITKKTLELTNWESIEGKYLFDVDKTSTDNSAHKNQLKVVGVINNFGTEKSPHDIGPTVIECSDNFNADYITCRVIPGDYNKVIKDIEKTWKEVYPGYVFNYHFYDTWLDSRFKKEQHAAYVMKIFAILAILISCLGTFGIIYFISKQRIKEIGIRKTNGAKVIDIMKTLNWSFIKWIVIAFIISIPAAYFIMHKYLEDFAYKTTLSWWIFVLAGVLALGIALLTVSWQSWRAATRNPVEALRYE